MISMAEIRSPAVQNRHPAGISPPAPPSAPHQSQNRSDHTDTAAPVPEFRYKKALYENLQEKNEIVKVSQSQEKTFILTEKNKKIIGYLTNIGAPTIGKRKPQFTQIIQIAATTPNQNTMFIIYFFILFYNY